MSDLRRTADKRECDLAEIRVARRMLCRSGMANDRVNGEMTAYVTRTEFRAEMAAIDKRFDAVDKRFDAVDQRFDAFEQRMIHSLGQMVIAVSQDLGRQIRASHDQLRVELRTDITQQIQASEERLRGEIRGLDDRYRDLPERVAMLEDHAGIKR